MNVSSICYLIFIKLTVNVKIDTLCAHSKEIQREKYLVSYHILLWLLRFSLVGNKNHDK